MSLPSNRGISAKSRVQCNIRNEVDLWFFASDYCFIGQMLPLAVTVCRTSLPLCSLGRAKQLSRNSKGCRGTGKHTGIRSMPPVYTAGNVGNGLRKVRNDTNTCTGQFIKFGTSKPVPDTR